MVEKRYGLPLCRIGTADSEELTVTLTYVTGRHLQHPHPDGLVEGGWTLVQQDPQPAARGIECRPHGLGRSRAFGQAGEPGRRGRR